MLKDYQDAFGHMMKDFLDGMLHNTPVVERDDGNIDTDNNPEYYFSTYEQWLPGEQKAMEFVKGRVLDGGCGAGRHSLYLQEKGHDVVGIDNSPLALEVARKRGVKDTKLRSISQISKKLGMFDTVLLLGSNFSLVGTTEKAKRILDRIDSATNEGARIIAQTLDPYDTGDPDHLSYHAANRAAGKWGGQAKLKYRYRKYATPWFDYLMVSKEEMENILDGTGWKINKFIESEGPVYIAIIDKKKR
jgi:SAM-dependent methyltransferase